MRNRPWWLRLDGVPPAWNQSPSSGASRNESKASGLYADLIRIVKSRSGAVFRVHARGRGVLDVLPGPLFAIPWLASWALHGLLFPNQYKVEIQWYHEPAPEELVMKGSWRWMPRSEALEVLDEIAEHLAETD